MGPLDFVNLSPLMARTIGRAEVTIGLIDGPVATDHPGLAGSEILVVKGQYSGVCSMTSSVACMHGTFVAGVLLAKRGSASPAVCPGCTLLVRPIFAEAASKTGDMPSATPEELAVAIVETVNAGAHLINLSAAVNGPSARGEREVEEALSYAAGKGVIVVAAAGNQGNVGSSAITGHPWVIPVVACDSRGRVMAASNLGSSIGRHGLSAPGENIASLGPGGGSGKFGGTSAAAPFVTGAIALLWSEFPAASSTSVRVAITASGRRKSIVPPLLNAWEAHRELAQQYGRNLS
jgi:subtilisin family serine protease